MVNSKYGKIFRQLREQKKLSLSHFDKMNIGLSKSALGRFERGETVLPFDKVDLALQEMNVTLGEYEYLINDFSLDYQEELLSKIEEADFLEDEENLRKIYQEALENNHKLIAYSAKSCFKSLEKLEQEEITDFLYEVDVWGYSEISILYFTISHLSKKEVSYLMKNFWQKNQHSLDIFKYRRRILQTAYRAIVYLSSKNYHDEADIIFQQCENQNRERDFFITILRSLAKSVCIYNAGNKELAQIQLNEAFFIISKLGDDKLVNYYKTRYNHYLN
jgi:Rgg/GadR/MutR family transcriptional activator